MKYMNPVSATMMTMVRIQVAKSESTLSSPTFAKMAVSAANAADKRAQKSQFDAVAMFE